MSWLRFLACMFKGHSPKLPFTLSSPRKHGYPVSNCLRCGKRIAKIGSEWWWTPE